MIWKQELVQNKQAVAGGCTEVEDILNGMKLLNKQQQ